MSEYTRMGYKLEFTRDPNALLFGCFCRRVVIWTEAGFQQSPGGLVARLQIIAPCTQGETVAALRAWLTAYGDPDLLDQIAPEVESAFSNLPEFRPTTPPSKAQEGQTN